MPFLDPRVLRWEIWWAEVIEHLLRWNEGRRRRRRGWGGGALVLSRAAADWNIPQRAAFSPIPSTSLAKVTRLRETVIVVITEFCVGGIASWAVQSLLLLWPWFLFCCSVRFRVRVFDSNSNTLKKDLIFFKYIGEKKKEYLLQDLMS